MSGRGGKRVRTALVNPPERPGFDVSGEGVAPPLGLAYIAAFLRQEGFVADLFDLHSSDSLADSVEMLEERGFFAYDLYGFTAYTKTFPAALDVAELVHQFNPSAVVVFGGPHASPAAEDILREYDYIDFVISNEGEHPMLALVQHLSSGTPPLHDVPNLYLRESFAMGRGRARVSRTTGHRWVKHLDDLPHPVRDYVVEPDRTSLRYERREEPVREIFVSGSRGCPNRCSFCSIVVSSPGYRLRSVESLMGEIYELHETYSFGHVALVDANFAVSPKRTLSFARALYDWRPDVTWSATATADQILRHAKVLPEIGRLNCVSLEVGIESGSSSQLRRYNKRTSVSDNMGAVRLLQRCGIGIGLDFIMFDPEVTLAELRENLDFLLEAELFGTTPPACLINEMRLYPGTPARSRYFEVSGQRDYHLTIHVPFVDSIVAAFHRVAVTYFRTYQRVMQDAIVLLQDLALKLVDTPLPDDWVSLRQEMVALTISLQHEPYRFFHELLSEFEEAHVGADATLESINAAPWHTRAVSLVRRAVELASDVPDAGNSRSPYPTFVSEKAPLHDTPLPDELTCSWEGAARAPGLVAIEQSSTVYLIPRRMKPVRLHPAGAYLWGRLNEGSSLTDTIEGYSDLFGTPQDKARWAIDAFLRAMSAAHCIVSEEHIGREVLYDGRLVPR